MPQYLNAHARAWLAKLRTTKSGKSRCCLVMSKRQSCPLGDALLMIYPLTDPKWRKKDPAGAYTLFLGRTREFTAALPQEVADLLGLLDPSGKSRDANPPISTLNDCTKMTKPEIADFIEAHAASYFHPLPDLEAVA